LNGNVAGSKFPSPVWLLYRWDALGPTRWPIGRAGRCRCNRLTGNVDRSLSYGLFCPNL